MPVELILFLLVLVPIGVRAWLGWRLGATVEIRHLLVYLFATLATLRYWHEVSGSISGLGDFDARLVAVAGFLLLFIVAGVVCAVAVDLRGECYQSVQTNWLDHGIGAVMGICSGGLLGGAILALLVMSVNGFDAAKLPVRLDQWPSAVFRVSEQYVAGIPPDDPAHTPLPERLPDDSSGKPAVAWK